MISIRDRVLYQDGKHSFHDSLEGFFIFEGINSQYYKSSETSTKLINGKPTTIEYINLEQLQHSNWGWIKTAAKITACILTCGLLPAVLGLGLMIERSYHSYEIDNLDPQRVDKSKQTLKNWKEKTEGKYIAHCIWPCNVQKVLQGGKLKSGEQVLRETGEAETEGGMYGEKFGAKSSQKASCTRCR